jgi:hypothetical protein
VPTNYFSLYHDYSLHFYFCFLPLSFVVCNELKFSLFSAPRKKYLFLSWSRKIYFVKALQSFDSLLLIIGLVFQLSGLHYVTLRMHGEREREIAGVLLTVRKFSIFFCPFYWRDPSDSN